MLTTEQRSNLCALLLRNASEITEIDGSSDYTSNPMASAAMEIEALYDFIDTARTIICNAGRGDWDSESPEWKQAARTWMDDSVGGKLHTDVWNAAAWRAGKEAQHK